MTDQEGRPAQNEAASAPGSRGGGSRGGRRRGRRGRNRGPGNDNQGSNRGRRNLASQNDNNDVTLTSPPAATPSDANANANANSSATLTSAPVPENSGASRGRRNRRGQRGGGRGQENQTRAAFRVGPQRQFGGRLTTDTPEDASQSVSSEPPALSGDAPEFVPGQSAVSTSSRRQQPQSASQSAPHSRPKKPRARPKKEQRPKNEVPKSTAPELWQRIQEDINNWNYECRVCTEEVTRQTEVWPCTLCWTVVHLECAHQWWDTSMKVNEETGEKSWRCPGCNSFLSEEPRDYQCWCGKEPSPSRASSIIPPHSCGQTCSKWRTTCSHPCTLQCHPGPCPPCTVLSPPEPCYCGKHTLRKKCRDTDYHNGWSCREPCGDFLGCGEHECPDLCHPGICATCSITVSAKCYCGRVDKEMKCSNQDDVCDSYNTADETWFQASFACGNACGRAYDCGTHNCETPCHPQDEMPAHCPLSPDVVSECPCGKTPLSELIDHPRQSCKDPVPHCEKLCEKSLKCGHLCLSVCHTGDCGACSQTMDIDCRCGRVNSKSLCHQGEIEHPLCFKVCQATRNCGRHRCGEHCCSGEKKAQLRIAQQKKQRMGVDSLPVEAEHVCVQTCGRPLKCGSHFCEQLCHRGACQSCPEAIWTEISCSCGETVLQPPQPCGTLQPYCSAKCRRQPACGHPAVDHQCHPDDVECPPCPFLSVKVCACGKTTFHNKPCHLQQVHCGEICGKRLQCGLHDCRKLCHRPGECGDAQNGCQQICGKTKLFCNHPCQNVCHGQTSCNESTACPVKLSISCPCGNRKKEFKCLASSKNPDPSRPEIKCDDECERLDRNRRLAAALNIDPASHVNDHVPYSDETLKYYKQSSTWCDAQESQFRVFAANNDEVRLRYEPMKTQTRQFLHLLAEDFGFDSRSEDYGFHRSVVVWKGPKFTSAPSKTLAQCVKIRAAQASAEAAEALEAAGVAAAAAALLSPSPPPIESEPFNAMVLLSPRFGITVEELNVALAADFSTLPGFDFKPDFLTHINSNDEVLIKANVRYSAFLTPAPVEKTLTELKPRIEQTIRREKLAEVVLLCHADTNGFVTRREVPHKSGVGGWSAVASRAASKPSSSTSTPGPDEARPVRKLLGLKKKKPTQPEAGKVWAALDGDVEC